MESQANAPQQPPPIDLAMDEVEKLRNEFLGGISWFYWIGALSVVNLAFIALAERKFILGLGISEVFLGIGMAGSGNSPYVWGGIGFLVSALFIGLGYMGRQGKNAFILGGLIFYALDALILVVAEDYLSVVFHAYAGYMIFKGWRALGKIIAAGKVAAQGAGAAAASAGAVKAGPADAVKSIPEEREKSAV